MSDAHRAMIEVVDLHHAFGRIPVLRGVNLRVEEGKTCVLLGISGSGKTVLIKHLIGLLHPDQGEVWMAGEELSRLRRKDLEAVRRQIGILFQSDALFDSMSVFDNVAFVLREQHVREAEVKQRVREILARVDLHDVEDELPSMLSGGMRKRVAFARAVVTRPRILLYDEPTAGLDPLTTQSVVDVITHARSAGPVTTLAVIFDVAAALQIADQLAFLHEGRIVASGPPSEVVHSSHPAVRAYMHEWLAQHGESADAPAGV